MQEATETPKRCVNVAEFFCWKNMNKYITLENHQVVIHFVRQPSYYITSCFIPTFMLGTLAYFTFMIHIDDFNDRSHLYWVYLKSWSRWRGFAKQFQIVQWFSKSGLWGLWPPCLCWPPWCLSSQRVSLKPPTPRFIVTFICEVMMQHKGELSIFLSSLTCGCSSSWSARRSTSASTSWSTSSGRASWSLRGSTGRPGLPQSRLGRPTCMERWWW